jgi:Protein of unknown function (DUF3551)
MRMIFALFIGLMAFTFAGPARADQYKWCANMGGGQDGGMMNCYFVTLQQCQAYVRGVGGFCMQSPFDGNRPATSWSQTQSPPQPQNRGN